MSQKRSQKMARGSIFYPSRISIGSELPGWADTRTDAHRFYTRENPTWTSRSFGWVF